MNDGVPVRVLDAPGCLLAVGDSVSGGVAVGDLDDRLVGVRVRAGDLVSDDDAVPD